MKKIITWWLCRKINDLLDQYKDNVSKVRETLKVWIARLEKIISCFKSLLAKLDDGKIDGDEIDQTVAEIEIVVKAW